MNGFFSKFHWNFNDYIIHIESVIKYTTDRKMVFLVNIITIVEPLNLPREPFIPLSISMNINYMKD